MSGAKRNLMLLLSSQMYEWRSMLVYRAQFVIEALFSILSMVITVVFIAVIYQISAGFSGWSFYQLLLLASTAGIAAGVMSYFVDIGYVNGLFVGGDLDAYLVKPFNPAFHLLATGGNRYAVWGVLSALVVFIYAAVHTSFAVLGLAEFVALLLFGIIALAMFALSLTAASYVLFTSGEFVGDAVSFVFGAGNYPLSIYGLAGTLILTLVLPIGLATYFPAEALFAKLDPMLIIAVFLLELAFILLSYLGFSTLLRKYTSALG